MSQSSPVPPAPVGWYFVNHQGQVSYAIVHVPADTDTPAHYSVRILLNLDPQGDWSEINRYHTWEDALAFTLEELAR